MRPSRPPQPPAWANRFLEWMLPPQGVEDVLGDLHEEFAYQVEHIGERRARWRYLQEVFGYALHSTGLHRTPSPFDLRPQHENYPKPLSPDMLRNYLKIAQRNLWRHRTVNAISIAGLSIGLACGLVIFLLVSYLFSFDRYHQKADRTYWLVTDIKHENIVPADAVPRPLGEVLRREYPFVESAVRLENIHGRIVSVPDGNGGFLRKFDESQNLCFTEPQFFTVFDVQWVSGNSKTALTAPNTVVLSERYAQKYFDTENPIGRVLRFDNQTDLAVAGIIKNPPANTKLSYDMLISYGTIPGLLGERGAQALQDWGHVPAMCFVTLREGTPVGRLQDALPAIRQKYMSPQEAKAFDFHVLPLTELSHDPKYGGPAHRPILYALMAVGLFLVIAACINFINLATAHALKRSKEVGVRKAMGSSRLQLIAQFMVEAGILTVAAVAVALVLTQLSLPALNQALAILHADLSILDLLRPKTLVWFTGLIAGVIVLAGLYPSLVVAGFNPVAALRGRLTTQQVGGVSVRRGLVVVQFCITQLFIIGVIVMMAQVRHMQQADLGFSKDAILTVPVPATSAVKQETLRNRLAQVAGVDQVALSSDPPASFGRIPTPFTYDTHTEPEKFPTLVRVGDMNFLPVFDLTLLAGRNFRTNDTTNNEAIINETMVKQLGLRSPKEVLGKRLTVWESDKTIVGVVADFQMNELRMGVPPTTIVNHYREHHIAALKLSPRNLPATVKAVEAAWNEQFPEHVFKAEFVDDILNRFYLTERILLGLIQTFSLVAILIGCLGLYGLVAFMAEAKTKEIGVRKVLGASAGQLLWLFGREFARLMVIGFVIAAPLGWFLMNGWLQSYVYRIEFGWWVFALTLVTTVLITLLTVSRESLKAALANPSTSLRSE
ncbi:ABC transporter permease [Nibrella saemangeumensis]|uniref:ABC transporter permease n=1 Tax=Nibrella saemangeumensis TaxID=1084526 RepID=A0ABP8MRY2_9BACT